MERITRRFCEGQLRRIAAMSGREVATSYPYSAGSLLLNDESGVKRLCVATGERGGLSDMSLPGCTTWRELSTLLRGIEGGLELAREEAPTN